MESTINSQECPKNSRKYCNYSWAVTVKTGEQPWQHIHQSTFLTVNNQDPENWTEQVNEWSVYYIQETWRSTKQQYTYFMRRTVSVYDKSNLLGSPCEIFMLCFPISINFFYTCFLNCFIHKLEPDLHAHNNENYWQRKETEEKKGAQTPCSNPWRLSIELCGWPQLAQVLSR